MERFVPDSDVGEQRLLDAEARASEAADGAREVSLNAEEAMADAVSPRDNSQIRRRGLGCSIVIAVTMACVAVSAIVARKVHRRSEISSYPQRLYYEDFPEEGGGGGGLRLFCWCIMRANSYEQSILDVQYTNAAGLFQCEDQVVFSEQQVLIGGEFETQPIGAVTSAAGGQGPLATSSWVNTDTFIRAWAELGSSSVFDAADWVVKVDPDTVFLPDVFKQHLLRHGVPAGVNLYLENCPNVDNGFYGAVEAISVNAFRTLVENLDNCRQTLPYQGWGEDLFAQKCMDGAGVSSAGDWRLVKDGNCHGTGMQPQCFAGPPAFHPFKSVDAWMKCWTQVNSGAPPPRGQGLDFPGAAPGAAGPGLGAPDPSLRAQALHLRTQALGGGGGGGLGGLSGGKHRFPTEMLQSREGVSGGGGGWWANLPLPAYHRL